MGTLPAMTGRDKLRKGHDRAAVCLLIRLDGQHEQHPQQASTQPPNPASSIQKFEMGGERRGVALGRKYAHGVPNRC